MTDPDLVHRAEQAYLGALLARRGRVGTGAAVAGDAGPDGLAGLRPQDFTDPAHQAIYAALADQAALRPRSLAGLYNRLRDLLSWLLLRARAQDAGAYMAGLPGMCPDPANLPAYAAMVAEASGLRTGAAPVSAPEPRRAAAENPRLASAGEWLDGTGMSARRAGRRRAAPASDAPAPRTDLAADDLAPDVARLARALRADARSATRDATGTARTTLPAKSLPASFDAEALQEQVLAGLMRRPGDGRDVASWLPDTVFTAGPRRTLYQLIGDRLADGRPVDPLIIAWDASLRGDFGGTAGTPGAVGGESLAEAALRLGALEPGPGSAVTLARALYAEQVCTDTFGPDWLKEPRRIPVPTSVPVPGPAAAASRVQSRSPEPGPSAAEQAAATTDDAAPSTAPVAEAEAAKRAGTGPADARHPMPALPRRAPSPPLLQPPVPGPAGPAPAQRI